MATLYDDVRQYVVALWKHWIARMAGGCGVAAWAIGAALEPMPVSLRWMFLALGTIAMIVAGFLVWRDERRARVSADERLKAAQLAEAGRLKLLRLVGQGKRIVERHASIIRGSQPGLVAEAVPEQHAWEREVEQTIKDVRPSAASHFADVHERKSLAGGSPPTIERTQLIIERIREVLDGWDRP